MICQCEWLEIEINYSDEIKMGCSNLYCSRSNWRSWRNENKVWVVVNDSKRIVQSGEFEFITGKRRYIVSLDSWQLCEVLISKQTVRKWRKECIFSSYTLFLWFFYTRLTSQLDVIHPTKNGMVNSLPKTYNTSIFFRKLSKMLIFLHVVLIFGIGMGNASK